MAGLLAKHGYNVITDEEKRDEADLWLLNSCTVKGPSEEHFKVSLSCNLQRMVEVARVELLCRK